VLIFSKYIKTIFDIFIKNKIEKNYFKLLKRKLQILFKIITIKLDLRYYKTNSIILKKIFLVLTILLTLLSCKKEDSVTCTSCNSPQTSAFEVCRESNENASVNGEDTGTQYDIYIDSLEEEGAICGG